MKKTLALIFVAAMLALSLVSCGGFEYDGASLVADGYVTLGDYKNIDINLADYEAKEVTDEDVYAHAVEHIGHSEELTTVDRPAEEFDLVNIAFVGTVDGVEFEGGASESTDLVIGAGNFIPGFEDGIIGMSVGETKDVNVTFPEDYGKEELNGKAAVFAITLNTVYDPSVLEDVRAELSAEDTEAELRDAVWTALKEKVTVNKYPESYVDELAQNQYEYYQAMYFQWGIVDAASVGLTKENCVNDVKAQLDNEFAIHAIANAEGITATDEEVDAKYEEYVQSYVDDGYSRSEAESMISKDGVETEVLQEKIIDSVVATLESTPAE